MLSSFVVFVRDVNEEGLNNCYRSFRHFLQNKVLSILCQQMLTNDGLRQGPEPGIGTGGYESGTDGISTDLSKRYQWLSNWGPKLSNWGPRSRIGDRSPSNWGPRSRIGDRGADLGTEEPIWGPGVE